MDKLKSIDWKQLAIDHGEKAVLGLVGLFALLSLIGTSWATYDKTPDSIVDDVKSSRSDMESSSWPEGEQEQFVNAIDIQAEANKLAMKVEVSEFAYSTQMSWPLIQPAEKVKVPRWERPEDPLASAGRMLMALRPEEPEGGLLADATDTSADGEMEADEPTDPQFDEFKRNKSAPRGPAGGGGMGSYPGGDPYAGMNMEEMMQDYGGAENMEDMYGGSEGGYPGMMGGATAIEQPARGEHYVAVRSVFPLDKQRRNLARAMHISPTSADLTSQVYVVDFNVERKEAQPGDDPWSGAWEDLDVESAFSILQESNGLDYEVIAPGVVDQACTMPLPHRITGSWDDASHPRVENYQLTPEQQEYINKQNQLMLEYYDKVKKELPPQPAMKKGFANLTVNINDVRSQLQGSNQYNEYQNQMKQVGSEMSTAYGSGFQTQMKQLDGNDVTASGNLILFRYLDFDVEPGKTYRYRVRLIFRNPMWNMGIDMLENPEIATHPTWPTDWSDETHPVKVVHDNAYFVEKIEDRPDRELAVEMDVFQWSTETGTKVNGLLKMVAGQMIGGMEKTEVARPAKETFEEEQIMIATGDVLVDIDNVLALNSVDHPDLRLPDVRGGYRLADEVLVQNSTGELTVVDSVSRRKSHENEKKYMLAQNAYYADEFKKAAGGMEGYPGMEEGGYPGSGGMGEYGMEGGDYGMEGGGGGGGRRRRGDRRRGQNALANPGVYGGASSGGSP